MTRLRARRVGMATLGTALVLAVLVLQSAASLPTRDSDVARLRLSWNARPERIEVCRELSDEELSRLAEHMRQRIECTGRFATYSLVVELDGKPVHRQVVRGSGLRNDRPIHLLQELTVEPGTRRLRVTFQRREKIDASDSGRSAASPGEQDGERETGQPQARAQREVSERARGAGAAIPPLLQIDTLLRFQAGSVVLLTLDRETRSLRVLAGSGP